MGRAMRQGRAVKDMAPGKDAAAPLVLAAGNQAPAPTRAMGLGTLGTAQLWDPHRDILVGPGD